MMNRLMANSTLDCDQTKGAPWCALILAFRILPERTAHPSAQRELYSHSPGLSVGYRT